MVPARVLLGVSTIAASQAQFQQPGLGVGQYGVPLQTQFPQPAPDFTQHGFQQFTVPAYAPGLAQFQQPADPFTQFQPPTPDFTQFEWPSHDEMQSSLQAPNLGSGSCGLAADADSECCQLAQASNPMAHGSPLTIGGIYCAQAADSRWWNVEVVKQNCDGSYRAVVQDDERTEWSTTQRALVLDMSCEDYWNEALREIGQPPMQFDEKPAEQLVEVPALLEEVPALLVEVPALLEVPAPLEFAEWREVPMAPLQERRPRRLTEEEPAESRIPVREKGAERKVPWKVITGALAAGAMPLVYHFSS